MTTAASETTLPDHTATLVTTTQFTTENTSLTNFPTTTETLETT